ncbi:MAG: TonB family protein [Gammaproteobacteria bacterium]|nr:TonB family protein [Gammaproteobacteria bacterium]
MANAYGASGSRRVLVLGIIIGMHVVMIVALKSGLARSAVQLITDTVAVDIPPPPPPPEDQKEPPPPPPIDRPPPMVPPPMIDLAPDTSPSNAISNVVVSDQAGRTPAAPPAPPPRQVVRTAPSFKQRPSQIANIINSCYPAASRRLNEEGRVLVDVFVGTDGTTQRAAVGQSSGFERLDQAALECVPRKLTFKPGTVDGAAIEAQVRIPILFKLE